MRLRGENAREFGFYFIILFEICEQLLQLFRLVKYDNNDDILNIFNSFHHKLQFTIGNWR